MGINDPKVIFETSLTEVRYEDVEGIGTLRWGGDGKCYRWVVNTNSSETYTAGQVVFHDFSDGANFHKYIDDADTDDLSAMAGVCMASLAAATGTNPKKYGWIQVLGYTAAFSVINQKTTVTAAGGSFKGIDGQVYLTEGQAMGTSPDYVNHIINLDAVDTVTTPAETQIAGYIKCL